MNNHIFDDLIESMDEGLKIIKGEIKGKTIVRSIAELDNYNNVTIKQIRKNSNMTQVVFAKSLGVSPKTVESWEKGTNKPSGVAKRLLSILQKEPRLFEKYGIIK